MFSDESQIVLEKTTKSTTHILVALALNERKTSLMIWGCICYDGVRTLTAVEGNINSAKYIDFLDKNLWPVVLSGILNEKNTVYG